MDYKAYLVTMTPNSKVQFIIFDTILSPEPFMKRWKEYTRSSKSDTDVILQQSHHNGAFRYIAQHRFAHEEVQFVFAKEKRSSRVPQESIKSQLLGGYSVLKAGRLTDTAANERKVFAFINCYPCPCNDKLLRAISINHYVTKSGRYNITVVSGNCRACILRQGISVALYGNIRWTCDHRSYPMNY